MFQGNYRLAKQHYTIALRYDPQNKMLLENIAKISRLEYNETSDELNTGEMYELLMQSWVKWMCFRICVYVGVCLFVCRCVFLRASKQLK